MNKTAVEKTSNQSWSADAAVTLFFTGFIAATYGFGCYLFPIIMADMKADLGFNYTVVGVITASAQLGFFVFALIAGALSRNIGGGRVIFGSVVICGLCLTLLSFVSNIFLIGFLFTILGACASSAWVPMVEVVGKFVHFNHRSKVLGLMSSGTSYGVFLNGIIVPFFIRNYTWRSIWLTVGIGTLLLAFFGFFLFSKMKLFETPSNKSTKKKYLDCENWLRQFLYRKVLIVFVIIFFSGFICIPFQTYLAPFLREEIGFSVEVSSQVWTIIGLVGMFGGFLIGSFSDRAGTRGALTLTYILLLFSALLLCLDIKNSYLFLVGISFGFAFYSIFGLIPAYISKTCSPKVATMVFGMANVMQGIGSMLGNFLGGYSKTLTGSFLWIYVTIMIVSVLLIVFVFFMPDERKFAV